jgi:hypothetical protein
VDVLPTQYSPWRASGHIATFGGYTLCKFRQEYAMQEESAEILLLESTTRGAIHPRSAQACIPVSVKSSPSFQIVENRYGPACSIAIALAGYQDQEYLAANDSSCWILRGRWRQSGVSQELLVSFDRRRVTTTLIFVTGWFLELCTTPGSDIIIVRGLPAAVGRLLILFAERGA